MQRSSSLSARATGGFICECNTVGNSNIDITPMLQRQQIVLSGITDVLAFNFNGAALPAGLSVSAWFAWMES